MVLVQLQLQLSRLNITTQYAFERAICQTLGFMLQNRVLLGTTNQRLVPIIYEPSRVKPISEH